MNNNIFPQNPRLNSDYYRIIQSRISESIVDIYQLYLKYIHGDRDKLGFFSDYSSTMVQNIYSKDFYSLSATDRLLNKTENKSY